METLAGAIAGLRMRMFRLLMPGMMAVLILLSGSLFAQNYPVMQEAFARSYELEKAKKYAEAVTVIKKVFREDSYEANLRLGWISYEAGNHSESAACYLRAIKLRPYAIEAKFGYVHPLGALGNWDQVIRQYNDILSISPHNTYANYYLGQIYYVRKDYLKALKYLEKVVNLYPMDYDALVLYAWINLRMGKMREAQVLFNKVLLIRPKDPSALEGLSMIK
ncbi:MAG TPA: tetratricopeptide repeat protein [Bacteroidales bacterium]|nr:tetratricopeptide repeat protein [Bacteroidales bacterium]HPS61765.1 tetratricopeptide repeat protein [Bacteroidales bacterium]